jgi:Domain of unknown function (DUF1772)
MTAPILSTPSLLVATSLGIGFSGFFAGANFGLSYIAIPGLLLPAAGSRDQGNPSPTPATPSSQLARQWRLVFHSGKAVLPWFALASSACFAYVAWSLPVTSPSIVESSRNLRTLKWVFVVAASLAILIAPWTFTVMKHTNAALQKRAKQADATAEKGIADGLEVDLKGNERGIESKTTEELIRHWSFLNFIRASLPFTAILTVLAGVTLYR